MAKRLVTAPIDYEPWQVNYAIEDEEKDQNQSNQGGKNTIEEKSDSSAADHDYRGLTLTSTFEARPPKST